MTARAPTTPAETEVIADSTPRRRPSPAIVAAAIAFGLACGAFEITNTAIGWHIAAGRWMLEHHELLDRDVFSFTSGGVEWIDHEWLFQIVAAGLYDLGDAPALVILRMLVVAALCVLLLFIAWRSGLDPPLSLLLAALCVVAARPRFFVRPELATLLLLPLAMWFFAERHRRRWWPLPLAAVVALGVNFHGAMLVAPILIAVHFAGEVIGRVIRHQRDRGALVTGATGVIAAAVATLVNPHGWRIWTVPLRLADMVRMPHIPNPEWASPGPADAPTLYVALVLAVVVLIVGRGAPQAWFGVAATASLAVKHIRNLGLFFVLLPQSLAPALARTRWLDPRGAQISSRSRTLLAVGLVVALGTVALLRPWPAPGFGFAERWYPERARQFLDGSGLLDGPVYNDVRFGGWLILKGAPDRRVFLDDRNEIHEPLLREIWAIFSASDVAAWEGLLERWGIETVLLRYHEPIRVATPDGEDLGQRGFSALWFPANRWATVYWDDVAIVLVRRPSVPESFLLEREYRVVHPDDLEHLTMVLRDHPELRPAAAAELRRALEDDPLCRRALDLLHFLASLDG